VDAAIVPPRNVLKLGLLARTIGGTIRERVDTPRFIWIVVSIAGPHGKGLATCGVRYHKEFVVTVIRMIDRKDRQSVAVGFPILYFPGIVAVVIEPLP